MIYFDGDDREVLQDAGKSLLRLQAKAETEFEKYRVIQDRLFMADLISTCWNWKRKQKIMASLSARL